MNISEKLSTIANNMSKVYDAGYEQGLAESGGGSDDSVLISIIDGSVTDLVIPEGVIDIREQCFRNITTLKSVHFPNGLRIIGNSSFYTCKNLETITWGENLHDGHRISGYAFQNCTSLKEVMFPTGLYGLDNGAFNGCTGLTKITFKNNPMNGIGANAFSGCTNLKDIYVPWAEGEVANAPWGATNATIHYNTVYDENHNPIIPTGLVYELAESMTFNGTSDYIDTGVKLYDTDKDFAILMEFENPTKENSETLIHCMREADPWPGVTMKVDGDLLFSVVGSTLMQTSISTTGVTRFALVKVGGYYTLKVMHNGITAPQVLKEGNVGYASIPNNLLLGAYQDNDGVKGRFWSGTINSCKVYFDTLPTDEETNAFLMEEV